MKAIALVLILLTLFVTSPPASAAAQSSYPENYREAYEHWLKGTFQVTTQSYWFESDGPLSTPLMELDAIGPNIVYLLIDELRKEQDKSRLYRLCILLRRLCGIDVRMGAPVGRSTLLAKDYPMMRPDFLAKWDAGSVTNPTQELRAARQGIDEDKAVDKLVAGSISKIRAYGVFALPYIVETLKEHNSGELFLAFLAVTAQWELYNRYLENPRGMFASQAEKLAFVKMWFTSNENRINQLQSVYPQLKAELQ